MTRADSTPEAISRARRCRARLLAEMRAITCRCAGDGPGLRRVPTRRFPPGGCGPGGRGPPGRGPGCCWSSPDADDSGAGATENLGQGEAPGSDGGLAPDGGFGHGEGPRPEEALDPAEGRVFGGGADG